LREENISTDVDDVEESHTHEADNNNDEHRHLEITGTSTDNDETTEEETSNTNPLLGANQPEEAIPEEEINVTDVEEQDLDEAVSHEHDEDDGSLVPEVKYCQACCDPSLLEEDFPTAKVTPFCRHEPWFCKKCLRKSIEQQLIYSNWSSLICMTCDEPLPFDVIKNYMTVESFAK
jgi:hypothetical protein